MFQTFDSIFFFLSWLDPVTGAWLILHSDYEMQQKLLVNSYSAAVKYDRNCVRLHLGGHRGMPTKSVQSQRLDCQK